MTEIKTPHNCVGHGMQSSCLHIKTGIWIFFFFVSVHVCCIHIRMIFLQKSLKRYSNIMIFCEDSRELAYLKLSVVQFHKAESFLYLKHLCNGMCSINVCGLSKSINGFSFRNS